MPSADAPPDLTLAVRDPEDVLWVRQEARRFAQALPWRPENLVRVDLIIAELASNMCRHAGGGTFRLWALVDGERLGLRIVASDDGPGIRDLRDAMAAGYSTAGSYGDGLATVKELADHFSISSNPGSGTCVEVEKWAP